MKGDRRVIRLLRLLRMLVDGRGHNADGLSKLLEVGRRTVFRDLQALNQVGVRVLYDPTTTKYWINSDGFAPPTDLTVEQVLAVWVLSNSLGDSPHMPLHTLLRSTVEKLRRKMTAYNRRRFDRMANAVDFRSPKLPNHGPTEDTYRIMLDAIVGKQVLKMVYASPAGSAAITTKFRPYKLIFNEHSWYVVGHSLSHKEIRTFNLARIESADRTRERFTIPKYFDWQERLRNAWTLYPEPGPDRHVVIKFDAAVAQSVSQAKWHPKQRIEKHSDGSITFHVVVSGLTEISWWILRYGEHAEVLFPKRLIELMAKRISRMSAIYAEAIEGSPDR